MIGIKDLKLPRSCSKCMFDYDLQYCIVKFDAYDYDYKWTEERAPCAHW